MKHLDFVNTDDEYIGKLFVTKRHQQLEADKVILPPKGLRWDRSSISDFLRLGINLKMSVIADWEGCMFEINFGVEYYLYFQYINPHKISEHGLAMHKKKSTKALNTTSPHAPFTII